MHAMKANVRILVSGMHSGPNPSPGLGIARSLRRAFDAIHITALDYSTASSGMHSNLVDERIFLPAWTAASVDGWASAIERLLAHDDTVYIPGLDLEARLLAERLPNHPGVLSPGSKAFAFVTKPAGLVAAELGIEVPPAEMECSPAGVERFLRQNPGRAWVKGQHYEAFPVKNAQEARAAGAFVSQVWGGSWHIEAHVHGQECGLVFAARNGVLVDAAFMAKSLLTVDGKTWAGQLEEVPAQLLEGLQRLVSMSDWTGGGEIELIRTWEGTFFAMELNPRFPAWIHGATVAGQNLPAGLVLGSAVAAELGCDRAFTRIVEEVPLHPDIGHVPFRWSQEGAITEATKHPSGVRALARLRETKPPPTTMYQSDRGHDADRSAALDVPFSSVDFETPHRVMQLDRFAAAVESTAAALANAGLRDRSTIAYSVKTCPDPRVMRAAAGLGLVPEVISQDELAAALDAGMNTGRAILNGPAKWWPEPARVACHAFFADSLGELAAIERRLESGLHLDTDVVGVRIGPQAARSRFGVRITDESDANALVGALTPVLRILDRPWGAHFHLASSTLGVRAWSAEVATFLQTVDLLSRRLGPPAVLDFGGGWHPDDTELTADRLGDAVRTSTTVSASTEIIVEPGKSLTQDAGVLVCRALLRREPSACPDIVVDATLGDLPEAAYRVHTVTLLRAGEWRVVPPGAGRLLGRSCMEADILALDLDLREVDEGDCLAFHGCGAYDASMSYEFGRGRSREHPR